MARAVSNVLSYALCILSMALLVGIVDSNSPLVLEAQIRDADQRKEVAPEVMADISYWRRHEANLAACRGQTYLYSCCDHSLDSGTLTCLTPEDIR